MRAAMAARLLVAPALVGGVIALNLPADADSGVGLADVRQATQKYHDPGVAEADGYLDVGLPCFSSDDGGMGDHRVDFPRVDDTIEALRPEAMVYDRLGNGDLKLVAVEYIAPRGPGHARPSLWGVDFNETTVGGTDLWTLHAWLWRGNPAGVLATWNPSLETCG
ncbi:hypothetical protein [Nocardioides jensenii]|uniref:hypothetical protein n=1 Tax=Nocardioides jensenii TaxID=1843 RepID=UPI00082C574D|nr:hypothetical protein [Nocardioides jensenii]